MTNDQSNLGVLKMAVPECVAEEFDGEIVALNVGTGVYCSMRDAGAALWRDLCAGRSVESLAQALADAGLDPNAVHKFADTIVEQGLMRPGRESTEQESAEQGSAENAPAPQFVVLAKENPESLAVEVFFDMKSLMLLDPVHEVDEAKGWPSLPENT